MCGLLRITINFVLSLFCVEVLGLVRRPVCVAGLRGVVVTSDCFTIFKMPWFVFKPFPFPGIIVEDASCFYDVIDLLWISAAYRTIQKKELLSRHPKRTFNRFPTSAQSVVKIFFKLSKIFFA